MISKSAERLIDEARRPIERISHKALGVVAFGSVIAEELWREGVSDIDLNIFMPNEWHDRMPQLAEAITEKSDDFNDVEWSEHPRVVVDDLQPRVEGVAKINDYNFDLTWATSMIQVNRGERKVLRDNLEVYLGQIYHYGIVVDGYRPDCQPLGSVDPYINDDELIQGRYRVVNDAYRESSDRTIASLEREDVVTATWHLGFATKCFMQAIHQKLHRYPMSYKKHARYQLEQIGLESPNSLNKEDIKRTLEDWQIQLGSGV